MEKLILTAICFIAPHHVGVLPATMYANLIAASAKRYQVDPFLMVAVVHVESSWNAHAHSSTGDWGLAQIHVSPTTNPELIGHEEDLFNPRVNLRYAGRMMALWKRYHQRSCDDTAHPYWAHLKFGYRVRDLEWSEKVAGLYNRLLGLFLSASVKQGTTASRTRDALSRLHLAFDKRADRLEHLQLGDHLQVELTDAARVDPALLQSGTRRDVHPVEATSEVSGYSEASSGFRVGLHGGLRLSSRDPL